MQKKPLSKNPKSPDTKQNYETHNCGKKTIAEKTFQKKSPDRAPIIKYKQTDAKCKTIQWSTTCP